MALSVTSRVFMNGNSQAVRIPRQFRLDTSEVEISRDADGNLVIHPLSPQPERRGDALLRALAGFDDEFTAILEADRADQAAAQDREPL